MRAILLLVGVVSVASLAAGDRAAGQSPQRHENPFRQTAIAMDVEDYRDATEHMFALARRDKKTVRRPAVVLRSDGAIAGVVDTNGKPIYRRSLACNLGAIEKMLAALPVGEASRVIDGAIARLRACQRDNPHLFGGTSATSN